MTRTSVLCLLAVIIASLSSAAAGRRGVTSQPALAQTPLSGSLGERPRAIQQVLQIRPADRTEELWKVLVTELRRVNVEMAWREEASRSGERVSGEAEPGEAEGRYRLDLARAVAQWNSTAAMEPLLDSVEYSEFARRGLVMFGDLVVQRLVDRVRLGTSGAEPVGALRSLRLVLEGTDENSPYPISRESKTGASDLAHDLLFSGSDHIAVVAAARLAVATGDPEVRRTVELLARDPRAVLADRHLPHHELIRREAAKALARAGG